MYMLCSHSKSALLTCTVTPYLLCFICVDCTLFTVNVLLLQCSFVYKMHPKEKTCSRSSINTTAQPKNTHFKSHVCISTSDIPCTITGILHITVSTSLSHIPPIACKCFFFWLKLHHHTPCTLYSHIPTRYFTFKPMCHMGNRTRHVFESQRSLIDQDSRVVSVYCMSPSRLTPPSPLHSQPEQRSQPDLAAELSQKCYRH